MNCEVNFSCLGLVIFGGHSALVLINEHGQFQRLGRTRGDATGEAFDKTARILSLGYTGGGYRAGISFRDCSLTPFPEFGSRESHALSFSGLKTALWHLVHKGGASVADVAASFQLAITDVLVTKTIEVAKQLKVEQILLSGGVAATKTLTQHFLANSPVPVLVPPPHLCTDNVAMVAACGYYHFQTGRTTAYDLDVVPSLSFD